ncbi:MAG: TlpA disulfide reductase family protein [Candidatus Entotheonellia bacterium]
MTVMIHLLKKFGIENLIFVLIIAAVLAFVLLRRQGFFLSGPAAELTHPASRTVVAPDFALPDLAGNLQHLSDFRGTVVLLNFWATWCPPCRAEMPSMETLYQAYKHQGFVILAVSSDVQGAAVVQAFMEGYHLSFPALLDTAGRVNGLYGVRSIPTSYLLDRRGRVVSREIGARNWAKAEARALVASLLNEPEHGPEDHAAIPSHTQ